VAKERISTSFHPSGPAHMLPPTALDALKLSAVHANEVLTVAVSVDYDSGELLGYRVFPSVVGPVFSLDIEAANDLLEGLGVHESEESNSEGSSSSSSSSSSSGSCMDIKGGVRKVKPKAVGFGVCNDVGASSSGVATLDSSFSGHVLQEDPALVLGTQDTLKVLPRGRIKGNRFNALLRTVIDNNNRYNRDVFDIDGGGGGIESTVSSAAGVPDSVARDLRVAHELVRKICIKQPWLAGPARHTTIHSPFPQKGARFAKSYELLDTLICLYSTYAHAYCVGCNLAVPVAWEQRDHRRDSARVRRFATQPLRSWIAQVRRRLILVADICIMFAAVACFLSCFIQLFFRNSFLSPPTFLLFTTQLQQKQLRAALKLELPLTRKDCALAVKHHNAKRQEQARFYAARW
jgi:hypothetical protein